MRHLTKTPINYILLYIFGGWRERERERGREGERERERERKKVEGGVPTIYKSHHGREEEREWVSERVRENYGGRRKEEGEKN